jgi:protoheme ferro-lyase
VKTLKDANCNFPVYVIDEWHKHPSYINALATILEEDILNSGINP